MSKPDSIAELTKESTEALRSYRETLKTLQDEFNAFHGGASELSPAQSCFLNCDDVPVPTLSLAPAADIGQVFSALGNLQIDNMEDLKSKIEQH
ncbi:hypothetical protein ERJ75_001295400 [Trypanosoma vivax]|nr:hypothetical protein ERJ75_001295400 [Trypanosoma vivax]